LEFLKNSKFQLEKQIALDNLMKLKICQRICS
jgi:hypothetical protein